MDGGTVMSGHVGALGGVYGGVGGCGGDAMWARDRELRSSERGQALTRYRQKRKLRHFQKTIRYASRQVCGVCVWGGGAVL
jgi:hypothetical protein